MGLGETGDWSGATERIVKMINGEDDPLEGALPEGYGSGRLLEQFSRQFESDYGVEMGMSLPALLAGFSGAMQGGYLVPMPKISMTGGKASVSMVWTPTVIQFIGIAQAGQSKSTLLKEVMDPLKKALDGEAAEHRRHIVEDWRKAAMDKFGSTGLKVDADAMVWEKVYDGGLCPSSVTDQGTPEGIRNNIVRMGGHRVILTAEPDVLAEVNQYQNKGTGGSIGLLLRGWGQEDLAVDRVKETGLYVREPSLPYVIMLQPDSFNRHTGAGGGHDDFVDRGLFSRSWLWRAERTPVDSQLADLDWDLAGLDLDGLGGLGSGGMATQMGALREKLADRMVSVALRSDEYRVSKGLEQAWAEHKVLWMPKPKAVGREHLEFDGPDGVRMGLRVQRMRDLIRQAVNLREAEREGTATLLDPLAVRFTDHVMRVAGVLTLADDPGATAVDTKHIEDAATRLVPWLWSGWMRVMRERMEANALETVEEGALKNPKGLDLTGGGVLLRSIFRLADSNGPAAMSGFTTTDIFRRARSSMKRSKMSAAAVTDFLHKELARLESEGLVEKIPGAETTNNAGVVFDRYRLTTLGQSLGSD